MTTMLSPSKIVLLATHLAAKADTRGFASLVVQHSKILSKDLQLRILLTCLPETVPSSEYVFLLRDVDTSNSGSDDVGDVDITSVADTTEEEAVKKVRKLKLLPLAWPNSQQIAADDSLTAFLINRAHRVDEEAGLLTQLPDLLAPFVDHSPYVRIWAISVLLPLLRRNHEYHPRAPIPQSLSEFESLEDRTVARLLLSQTGAVDEEAGSIGRDLRGLIGPWLYSETRWINHRNNTQPQSPGGSLNDLANDNLQLCPGWEEVLEWITGQALKCWKISVKAFEQWDGPDDIDLGGYGTMWLNDDEQQYLEMRYARAALATAYLIPEASVEALTGSHTIVSKIITLLGENPSPTLQVGASMLSPLLDLDTTLFNIKNATLMRNDLLKETNVLTTPNKGSIQLLNGLIMSAFILTKASSPCTTRRAGELVLLQDEREQKAEAIKFIHNLGNNGPKSDDKYWIRARNEVFWLRDWGAEEALAAAKDTQHHGIFGRLSNEFLETEILKAFLSGTRYSLARSIYEESREPPLPLQVLHDTILAAAMNAYDNASNPNRLRGGVKRCDDILHAFPKTFQQFPQSARKIGALLKATHALSKYRLVLKQGEPFTPVVLRVHTDPTSIIGKVLEQNPKSYTEIQDLINIGVDMVDAELTSKDIPNHQGIASADRSRGRLSMEKRVIAMCIDAALTEDDFETAYSYVVTHLAPDGRLGRSDRQTAEASAAEIRIQCAEGYAWKAALQAGRYRRTARTVRPTHIGTASSNLDIRHLEQRMECLSAALRIAPPTTLPEILNVFRRCEEELDAAIKAEEEQEAAWDEEGDLQAMPGGFNSMTSARNPTATQPLRQAEEAPMSLFDLSRASVERAQKNFSAISSLQRSGHARNDSNNESGDETEGGQPRVRKRDQLREAAVGTLASGVGWLIGAQPVTRTEERE